MKKSTDDKAVQVLLCLIVVCCFVPAIVFFTILFERLGGV